MPKTLKKFASKSNASVSYELVQKDDGSLTCTCPAFNFSRGEVKSCCHTREYLSTGAISGAVDPAAVPVVIPAEDPEKEEKELKASVRTAAAAKAIEALKAQAERHAAEEKRKKAEEEAKKKAEEERLRKLEEARLAAAEAFTPKLSYKVKKTDRSILWPEKDPFFHVSNRNSLFLQIIHEMSQDLAQNVLLTGPHGCGKTEMAVWFAARYDRPMVVMNCATIREARDWFGYKDAKDGDVFWHMSDFVKACRIPNCVIVMDEFNRLHSTLHNTLYPLLDARRQTWVEELGEMIDIAKGVVFFATCNIGAQHTGTFTLDTALEDRLYQRVECKFLPRDAEIQVLVEKTGIPKAEADKLVDFARDVRAKVTGTDGSGASLTRAISTRQLLATAILGRRFRAAGKSYHKALYYTVIPYYAEDERPQVKMLMQGKFDINGDDEEEDK